MSANLLTTSKSTAIQRAKNYRGAKAGLQAAIGYAVAQLLQGNADGLHIVMSAAGLIENRGGEMHANADGRAVWAYLTKRDALGLTGIVAWDKESGRFRMCKNWTKAADDLDLAHVVNTLANVRWDQYKAAKADQAFDLNKAVVRLVHKARSNGITDDDAIMSVVRQALKTA